MQAVKIAAAFSVLAVAALAQDATHYNFTSFTVTGAVSLGVESINTAGTISGYLVDSAGNNKGFLRATDGAVTVYSDPKDTGVPGFTVGGQINRNGVVAGQYYDPGITTYLGYIYNSTTNTFKNYKVPGQPKYTTTALNGINDRKGDLCGFVWPPPYTLLSAFVTSAGTPTIFSVNGSTNTVCTGLNDASTAVGYYTDAAGVDHGWVRTSSGQITTIDAPGASTVTGTAPCSGTVGGTVIVGINNHGDISGHYWDTSYNEHGFIMNTSGKYFTIDFPGAYETSGGGINNNGVLVGHYDDISCNPTGYIAAPPGTN
jgi:hypothetical protein